MHCLEKAIRDMTYTVSGGTLNPTHSLTDSLPQKFLDLLLHFGAVKGFQVCIFVGLMSVILDTDLVHLLFVWFQTIDKTLLTKV